jgi:hypothetical protein
MDTVISYRLTQVVDKAPGLHGSRDGSADLVCRVMIWAHEQDALVRRMSSIAVTATFCCRTDGSSVHSVVRMEAEEPPT